MNITCGKERVMTFTLNWISVKNRLPELHEIVLVTGKYLHCARSYMYDKNKFKRDNARTRQDKYPVEIVWNEGCCCDVWDSGWEITHWMPLPEEPK